jgi:hypothetical protein
LEADKSGEIPMGTVENRNYIKEELSLLPGDLVFIYLERRVGAGESSNETIW